ncbi:diguanylate cyclase [Candidatus Micrarchaeota archaeon]|nr:diguanylate cyclase [Candidatus Micrarchaeota archaeon]
MPRKLRKIKKSPVEGRDRPRTPLDEPLMKSEIVFHGVGPMKTNLAPDFHAASSVHRIARMVTENFQTIGEYVSMLMGQFRRVKSCTIYVSPKNMPLVQKSPLLLEHRLTVKRQGNRTTIDESTEGRKNNDGFLVAMMEEAFLQKRPIMLDHDNGIKINFGNLDMDSDSCDVYPLERNEEKGSIAIMPFYYRDRGQPSGVVVFEGDLGCSGSKLEGFAKSYWSAKAAIASAAQISFQLTHKFDAITILTKIADFNVDFETCIQNLMKNKVKSLYLVMLDLDDFKKINDNYGYNTGNEVLRKVAETTKASVRSKDLVSRWGGEEFVALLQNVTEEEARIIAERIRRSVAGIRVRSPTGDNVSVTCSIGISDVESVARELAREGETESDRVQSIFEAAFNSTDRNLKDAKRNGKDRISFGGDTCAFNI